MTYVADSFDTLPRMPPWVTSARAETPEDVAFLSGAALNHLHLVLNDQSVPQTLLRARLTLRAAEACLVQAGRPERVPDLRDAVAFLQPGDSPGPAGEVYQSWRRAIERPVSVNALHRALPDLEPEQIAIWLDAGQGAPISQAATVLQRALADRPRDQTAALVLADAALAQALGWSHVPPLLALGLKRSDHRKTGEELRMACHGVNLARHAARLREVAPKLRAKGANGSDVASLRSGRAPLL